MTDMPRASEPTARKRSRWMDYRPFELSPSVVLGASVAALAVVLALLVLHVAHQPARQLPWTVARAAGLVAYGLLWILALTGVLRAHPRLKSLGPYLLPWHQWLGLFTLSFAGVHGVAVIVDPYAGVGLLGALWPGLSHYRTIPVALGTIAFWALLLVGITARFGQRWLDGVWQTIHKGALAAFVLAFFHGVLTGSDTRWLDAWYAATGITLWLAALWRYWTPGEAPPGVRVRKA